MWLSNSLPWPYAISTGHGYCTSHVVSTKFAFVIAFLSLYCFISNHPVTGSIIVTDFNIKGYLPFLRILLGPIRYTHSLFHGISSSSLADILPYFYWPFCVLEYVTFRYFLIDGSSNVRPVQMLVNHCLHSIQSWMKEIHVITFQNISLE